MEVGVRKRVNASIKRSTKPGGNKGGTKVVQLREVVIVLLTSAISDPGIT